jgi:hypothetical protein
MLGGVRRVSRAAGRSGFMSLDDIGFKNVGWLVHPSREYAAEP